MSSKCFLLQTMMKWDDCNWYPYSGVPEGCDASPNPHLPPFFTDPDRGQVTRLEVEATIPPAASPQPLLIVSLQEEQDKCKGMSEG